MGRGREAARVVFVACWQPPMRQAGLVQEGTAAARLFQLAIGLLVPTGFVFVVTADWRRPLQVAKRLVVPAVALVVAFSTLYYMEHLW